MHYNHLLHDKGLEKLQESGLDKRADIAKRHEDTPYLGNLGHCLDSEEYLYVIEELQEKGFLDWNHDFADGFFRQLHSYNERMNPIRELIRDPSRNKWQIKLHEGLHKEGIDLNEDLGLFGGYFASFVLTPEEFWNPGKFAFDNLGDLWGTLGIYMKMDRGFSERSYKYKSQVDGKTFVTHATGDTHGDFRLHRTDITPYETRDPLGNKVSYRPEISSDRQIVATYYGVEPSLLALTMKWVDQEGIESKILEDPDKFLLEFAGQGKYLGDFGDAGCHGALGPRGDFIGFEDPMTRLDEKDNIIEEKYWDLIGGGNGQNTYRVAIDANGRLAFSFFKDKSKEQGVVMRIPKEECDEFIRSLVIQTQMGLGRTSFSQMEDTIKYRFSEQFIKDREEEKQRNSR